MVSGDAWRSFWSVFGALVLLITGLAVWWWSAAEGTNGTDAARRNGGAVAATSDDDSPSAARDGLIVPAGFMRAPSGALLPRFAMAAQPEVQVRLGPGRHYPVAWILRAPQMPLEVLAEADGWLRIRDHEGEEGWVKADAVDGARRAALVAPWRRGQRLALRAEAAQGAPLRAWLGSGVVVRLLRCDGRWCEVRAGRLTGWLEQTQLWGVYNGERIGGERG